MSYAQQFVETVEVREDATATVTADFGPRPGESMTVDLGGGLQMAFAWIPPGEFLMGSPDSEQERADDETQHRVTLTKGFWMGRIEVTQKQWELVTGSNPSRFKGDSNPVERVSWDACQDFLRKINSSGVSRSTRAGSFRLPTEAEWEYACRAGTTGPYAGNLDDMGWYGGNSGSTTHPAGQKRANGWGLYDMHGNVLEWCQDWDGKYDAGAVTNPAGPSSGSRRILRGGSWFYGTRGCRSASRNREGPAFWSRNRGFRVAVSCH